MGTPVLRALCLLLALCLWMGGQSRTAGEAREIRQISRMGAAELVIFADDSLSVPLRQIGALYRRGAPYVTIRYDFDSSAILLAALREGAACDLFLPAAQSEMDAIDGALVFSLPGAGDSRVRNSEGLDLLLTDSRTDLLESRMVLVAPEENPKGVQSFWQLSRLLQSGEIALAVSEGPALRYLETIFSGFNLSGNLYQPCLRVCSSDREALARVSEGMADCAAVFLPDAMAAGLSILDEAPASMSGRVLYPAAVLAGSAAPEEARAFLDFLCSPEAMDMFQRAGFTAPSDEDGAGWTELPESPDLPEEVWPEEAPEIPPEERATERATETL